MGSKIVAMCAICTTRREGRVKNARQMSKKMNKDEEIVCYIIIRNDLGMSPGKMVAQGGHAVHMMIEDLHGYVDDRNRWFNKDWNNWYIKWLDKGITKIVLTIDSEEKMWDIIGKIRNEAGYVISYVIDEGRTEIPEGSLTAACLQPMPRKIAKQFVGHLKLL